MKVWERVVEARLRKVVEICEQQYGFMPRKSTTDAIFALRILMEKYRDGQRELHCVFVDLEKAYDRVPREELWYCMRKSGVAEKYVRVVQDMYERSRTVVRCAVGQTEEFNVEVGLHQGSALSPFLFAIVMDQLSEEIRQESPWTMMFADDIVICSESREQVEENLERWRFVLERRGMKVSRSKTEYMCVNEREGSGTVRLQGEEVKKVQEFKYLGSTVQSNGECGKEVKKRVQAGWNGWRKVSGVLCDRKISARIKGKVYRTVVRPAMLYGLETVSLRKRQESELEVAELKMLRFSLGVTRLDRIRNKYIRGTAHVGRLGDKVREARLRWFGHVQRRESEYIGRRMLDMELPGRRQRGRPKRRYMDGINEDMKLVGASVEDAEDRDRSTSGSRRKRRHRSGTPKNKHKDKSKLRKKTNLKYRTERQKRSSPSVSPSPGLENGHQSQRVRNGKHSGLSQLEGEKSSDKLRLLASSSPSEVQRQTSPNVREAKSHSALYRSPGRQQTHAQMGEAGKGEERQQRGSKLSSESSGKRAGRSCHSPAHSSDFQPDLQPKAKGTHVKKERDSPHYSDAERTRRRSRSYSPIRKRRRDSPSFMEARRITSARKRPIPYYRPSPSSSSSLSSYSSSSRSRSRSQSYNSYSSYSRSRSRIRSKSRSRSRSRSRGRSRSSSQSRSPSQAHSYYSHSSSESPGF
ncbi:hypothetical protein QTP70_028548 [Hemibagrus guttatus]|uniref:ribonuclease H n=1 Tax=Hemibagrus guttatus TaxID=175788 RepID=A0AAE0PWT7_9TELE|nr:hypothetical protein QTP70_028548 [Hemibagrus guttatus]